MTKFWPQITLLSWATYLVSIGNNIVSRASPAVSSPTTLRTLLPLTSTADKLPLEREQVAPDNNTIFTLKPVDQTFVPPYSTDNRSIYRLGSEDMAFTINKLGSNFKQGGQTEIPLLISYRSL